MDQLTNFYKNRLIQLEEQMNNLQRMFNEANSTPPPTLGVASDGSGTGIDPRMFDPRLMPPVDKNPNNYDPGWKENRMPRPSSATEGSFWFDTDGNMWQLINGRWVVVGNPPNGTQTLPIGYPDSR